MTFRAKDVEEEAGRAVRTDERPKTVISDSSVACDAVADEPARVMGGSQAWNLSLVLHRRFVLARREANKNQPDD